MLMRARLASFLALVSVALGASARAEGPVDPQAPATFDKEVTQLRRLVACDTRVPDSQVKPPDGITLKQIDGSCKKVKAQVERFRKRWLDKARPFIAELVPKDISKTIVYPFGGADLMTALTVYPDLELLTTMSLEWVGDPRAILTLDAGALRKNLAQQHAFLIKLFQVNHNRTVDLQELNQSPIPAPLVFGLKALDLLGYEPVSARWFQLGPNGEVKYLTPDDIKAFDAAGKKQKDRNEFFANMELSFRKSGVANAPIQVWRHMRVNLHDDNFKKSPTLAYLEHLGPISGITKAASYLMWREDFGVIRNFMLDHMRWMISDTTGPAPFQAAEKGFVQDTWGTFRGNMFPGPKKAELAMIELWKTNPQQVLPFTFGYPDVNDQNHMMVTRKR